MSGVLDTGAGPAGFATAIVSSGAGTRAAGADAVGGGVVTQDDEAASVGGVVLDIGDAITARVGRSVRHVGSQCTSCSRDIGAGLVEPALAIVSGDAGRRTTPPGIGVAVVVQGDDAAVATVARARPVPLYSRDADPDTSGGRQ
ncbi:hypothetical protein AB0B28_10430 [Glycomyces sp. NPDC046736]|uniref:hypothetical protein n=1 Tax=Glycomyces sp. NPDC046736 TaxID=3155615 RepID=UPI0033F9BEE9